MSAAADLLIELGTEELPPKALLGLSTHFHQEILRGLADAGITHGVSRAFATPRRLAVLIDAVPARQPDQKLERRGPALAAAYDKQGAPSGAALGFARSGGVDFAALERLETDKGAWLVFRSEAAGQTIDALIPGIVERALADKLDSLTGMFGVGGAPTGDKDPYALRRAALGCLRICIESDSAIDLAQALEQAALLLGGMRLGHGA